MTGSRCGLSNLVALFHVIHPSLAETEVVTRLDSGRDYGFGPDARRNWLAYNGFDFVLRAHRVAQDGYKLAFHPEPTVVTTDYCGLANRGGR
jgi:hypothetical protein